MFFLDTDSGFTDANERKVRSLDIVEYEHGVRRGVLLEALCDGDAYVLFRDTKKVELVKWRSLCRVPEAVGPGAPTHHAAPAPRPPSLGFSLMCSGARQFPARPIADIVAAINGAAQIPHLRATVDDLTRQRGNVLKPGNTLVLRESPVDHGGGVYLPPMAARCDCALCREFEAFNHYPAPAPDIAQLGGSVDVSALRADTHDVGPSPSVAQDSDRGRVDEVGQAFQELGTGHDG